MFVIGPNRKEFENQGVSCNRLHRCAVVEMVAKYNASVCLDIQPFIMSLCWFGPVILHQGKAVSCVLLVKHHDEVPPVVPKMKSIYGNPVMKKYNCIFIVPNDSCLIAFSMFRMSPSFVEINILLVFSW